MEIFITGDTHGDFRRFRPDIFYEQEHMTKEDLVLVCGDFGGIWHGDPRDDAGLDWLEDRPYTTAFVLGNHENYDAYKDYPKEEWQGGQIQRIRPSVLHLMRGQVYELNGRKFLPWAALPPMIFRTASWNRTILTSRKSSSNSNSAVRCFV